MKQLFLLVFVIGFSCSLSKAQDNSAYRPIKSEGKIPEEFFLNPNEKADLDAKNQDILDYEEAKSFFYVLNIDRERWLRSGDIYFEGPLTKYVNYVLDNLLKYDQELRKKITVFVTRYLTTNAYMLADGSLFINSGILSKVENEAQLAFILAHEISHFEKKHSLTNYKKALNSNDNKGFYVSNAFNTIILSKESEFNSDNHALDYLIKANYDPRESLSSLELLKDTLTFKYNKKVDFEKWFGKAEKTPEDIADEYAQHALKYYNASLKTAAILYARAQQQKTENDQSESDLFDSHPSIEKRMAAVGEYISMKDFDTNKLVKNTSYELSIKEINKIAMYEAVNTYYLYRNYAVSLYCALQLDEEYPNDYYLQEMIIKNLYWIAYYMNTKNLESVVKNETFAKESIFKDLLFHIEKSEAKKINNNLYEFVKDFVKKNENTTEDTYLYYIQLAEDYVGKNIAKMISEEYLKKYTNTPMSELIRARFDL